MHPNYSDFLSGLSFDAETVTIAQAQIAVNLAKNNIPELALPVKQINDYVNELIWTLANQSDITYLKSNLVDLWDHEVNPATAIYGDYTAAERARLHGNEELFNGFANYIKQYTSELPVEGWLEETAPIIHKVDEDENVMLQRGQVKVVRYLHPDIEAKGHAWLDQRGIKGGAKELIFGEVKGHATPNTLPGLRHLEQGRFTMFTGKRMPFEGAPELTLGVSLIDIPREEIIGMMLEARVARDVDDADVRFDELKASFPSQRLNAGVVSEPLVSLEQFDMVVFQASVLMHIIGNTIGIEPNALNITVEELTLSEGDVAGKLEQLEREDLASSHLFFHSKLIGWHEYALPMFEFM